MDSFKKFKTKQLIAIVAAILAIYLVIRYWPLAETLVSTVIKALNPVIIGAAMAYVVNIPMKKFESLLTKKCTQPLEGGKKLLARIGALLLAFATIFIIISAVFSIVIPELTSCITVLIDKVPKTLNEIADTLSSKEFIQRYPFVEAFLLQFDATNMLSELSNTLGSKIGEFGTAVIGSLASFMSNVLNVVLAVIFACYILIGKEELSKQFVGFGSTYIPGKIREKGRYVLSIANKNFHNFIVGQFVEAIILGVLCALGMVIFRFPYATMVGATMGMTALIPVVGAYIGGAVGFLMILTVNPAKAFLFIVYIIILQQLEGNIVYPRVVGKNVGLPAIWTLIAITVGGSFGGVVGMLLGVPVFSTVYEIVKNDMEKRAARTAKLEE